MTLMLLRTQTKYKDNSEKVTAIFNYIFAPKLRESGYENGIEKKRLVDAWNSRKMSGRGRQWLTVDAQPKTEEERLYRRELLRQIHRAANVISVSNDGDEDVGEKSSERGVEKNDEDDAEGDEDGRTLYPMDMCDEDLDSGSEASREVAQEEKQQVQAHQPLEMIHAGQGSWGGRVPLSSSTAFIDHEDPL
jgi:hypothetical protein